MSIAINSRVSANVPAAFAKEFLLDISNWPHFMAQEGTTYDYSWEGPPWKPGSQIIYRLTGYVVPESAKLNVPGMGRMQRMIQEKVQQSLQGKILRYHIVSPRPGELFRIAGQIIGMSGEVAFSVSGEGDERSIVQRSSEMSGWAAGLGKLATQSMIQKQQDQMDQALRRALEGAWAKHQAAGTSAESERCRACGEPLRAQSKFCGSCGTPVRAG